MSDKFHFGSVSARWRARVRTGRKLGSKRATGNAQPFLGNCSAPLRTFSPPAAMCNALGETCDEEAADALGSLRDVLALFPEV